MIQITQFHPQKVITPQVLLLVAAVLAAAVPRAAGKKHAAIGHDMSQMRRQDHLKNIEVIMQNNAWKIVLVVRTIGAERGRAARGGPDFS